MRAVNLLPSSDRPVRAVAQGSGSYIVLGVLGALLIAVLGVVLTQNQVNSRTGEIARAQQEQQEAEAKAARLGSFGQFAGIKETRLASVTDLAQARFDWERLMREVALVLPDDTWINEASASATGAIEGETPPAGATASGGPTLKLIGCAPSQTTVAEVMVRLRNLHRAQDVALTESGKPEIAEGAGAAAAAEPTQSVEGCGDDYQFDTTVSFSPGPITGAQAQPEGGVPASLGGGS